MSNERKKCPHCRTIFIGSGYEGACTKDCHFKKMYEEQMKKSGRYGKTHEVKEKKVYVKECKTCKSEFEANQKNIVYCSYGCSLSGKKPTAEDKIRIANEKWMNPKPRKKSKYSIDDLNRMAEWKRVWDDESWTRNYNRYRG